MNKGKLLVTTVIVLGAAYVGATWYVGKEVQSTVERLVAQSNERMAQLLGPNMARDNLNIEINKYERGLFSSDVVYTFRLKGTDGKQHDLMLKDHLLHGPLPWEAMREGEFTPVLALSRSELLPTRTVQAWMDSQRGASPVVIDTRIDFGGKGSSEWTFLPTELSEGGSKVSFSGGSLSMRFSNDFKDVSARGGFKALNLFDSGDDDSFALRDVRIETENVTRADASARQQSSLTAEQVVLDEHTDEPLKLGKVAVSVDATQVGTMMDGAIRYDFGQVAAGDIKLGSFAAGGKVLRLDAAAFTALAGEYDAIQAKYGTTEFSMTDEEQERLRDRAMALLASSPSIVIDPLVWKNEKGESTLRFQLDLAAPTDPKTRDIEVLLSEIIRLAGLDLKLSKAMFVQAFGQTAEGTDDRLQMEMMGSELYDQYVNELQQAGLVKVDGDVATGSVLYQDRKVTLNGETMTVEELVQRIMLFAM